MCTASAIHIKQNFFIDISRRSRGLRRKEIVFICDIGGPIKMEANKKYNWYKIADSIEEISFPENGLTMLEVNNKTICVALNKDQLFACSSKCPHAGGVMADGYIDALGNIVCPVHRYKFSLHNGRNSSGEGYHLKNFPVEIRKEGVFVGFAENNLFGWLK